MSDQKELTHPEALAKIPKDWIILEHESSESRLKGIDTDSREYLYSEVKFATIDEKGFGVTRATFTRRDIIGAHNEMDPDWRVSPEGGGGMSWKELAAVLEMAKVAGWWK